MHTHSCMYTPSHCHTHVHTKHTHVRTCTAFCNAAFLPARQENLTNPAAYVRSTVVTAFKYTITDQPQLIDVLLKACIGDFLRMGVGGERRRKWWREKEVGGEALVGAVPLAALPSHCCCCECRPVCCCPVTEGWCDALYSVLTVFYNASEEPEHSLPW